MSDDSVIVYKGRTNVLPVNTGMDLSGDTVTSEIRTADGTLIATWDVEFAGDGTDGKLILTLDDSVTSLIVETMGKMDLKRVSAGEPYPIFADAVEVEFRKTVTL